MLDQGQADRLDSGGLRVKFGVTSELVAETVFKFPIDEALVKMGPHAGHRLANGTKGVFHCPRSDGLTIFGKAAIAVALSKNLEVRDRVWASFQKGVNGNVGAVINPDGPGVIVRSGTLSTNGKATGSCCKVEVRAERMGGRRVVSCQGRDCG